MDGDDLDDDLWWRSPDDELLAQTLREMHEAEVEQMRPFYEAMAEQDAELCAMLREMQREQEGLYDVLYDDKNLPRDVAEVLGIPPVIDPGWLK